MKFDANPKTGDNKFLKIESGESVQGILRGDVRHFYIKWGEDEISQECSEGEEGAKFRFRVNFVSREKDGSLRAYVLEQGPGVYKQLKELNEDYNLEETIIKIKKEGSGRKTKYSLVPLPKKLGPEVLEELNEVHLHPLKSETEDDEITDVPF